MKIIVCPICKGDVTRSKEGDSSWAPTLYTCNICGSYFRETPGDFQPSTIEFFPKYNAKKEKVT